jgi:hypothetical protein
MKPEKTLVLFILFTTDLTRIANAQMNEPQKKETKTIEKIEFKKYEKIDLGNISIEGEHVNPEDIMIKESERKRITEKLYERKNLDEFTDLEIQELR